MPSRQASSRHDSGSLLQRRPQSRDRSAAAGGEAETQPSEAHGISGRKGGPRARPPRQDNASCPGPDFLGSTSV
eukprot:5078884-Pyramimonas_sp.AAC.1